MSGAAARPGVALPPPLVYLGGFAVGVLLELVAPTPNPPLVVAVPVALTGLALWALLDAAAMGEFGRAGTDVTPSRPATRLVTSGPYRWTRNPMYLGMAVLHAALAIAFGVLWALLLLVCVLVVVDRVVVPREERQLVAAFGENYTAYRRRVRRWL